MIDIKKCIRSSSTLSCIVTKKTMIFIFFYTLVTTSYTMAINSGLFIGRWLCEFYPYLYIKFWYVASVQIKSCLLDRILSSRNIYFFPTKKIQKITINRLLPYCNLSSSGDVGNVDMYYHYCSWGNNYPYLYIKFWYGASVQIKSCLLDRILSSRLW
jgi:hypothetical protein